MINLPLSSTSLQTKMNEVINDVCAMKSLKLTDGWVPANMETFRVFRKLRQAIVHQANENGMTVDEISEGMRISKDEIIDLLANPLEVPIDVGVLVRSKEPDRDPLHCGSGIYRDAVVISMEPFVLVSKEADMRWGAWSADRVIPIERVSEEQLEKCMTRLEK